MRRMFWGLLAVSLILLTADATAHLRTGRLGGTILQSNGRPAAGAHVFLERSDGTAPIAARTNSHGEFLFKFILEGLYDVRASSGAAASVWRHNVMVHAGRETKIDLQLEPPRRKVAANSATRRQ